MKTFTGAKGAPPRCHARKLAHLAADARRIAGAATHLRIDPGTRIHGAAGPEKAKRVRPYINLMLLMIIFYSMLWSLLASSDASWIVDRFCAEFPARSLLTRKNSLRCLRREFIP